MYLPLLTGLGKGFLQAGKFLGKECWLNNVFKLLLTASQRKFKFKHALVFND